MTLLELGRRAHAERTARHGARVYYCLAPMDVERLECRAGEEEAAVRAWQGSARALAPVVVGETGQTTGEADLRLIALARIHLPQVEHIVADSERLSPYVAQVALRFGASQLAGFAAGTGRAEIERVIRQADLEPFECDANYQPFTSAETGLTVLSS